MKNILITGTSGYLGANLSKYLKRNNLNIIGIDKVSGRQTDFVIDLSKKLSIYLLANILSKYKISCIIHCAAARTDIGLSPQLYYKANVLATSNLLKSSKKNVRTFINISSVAAIDGMNIQFSNLLNCDDAYRSTKYLQEKEVFKYRKFFRTVINFQPSAIYGRGTPKNTNIYKLLWCIKKFSFFPYIESKKSLTYIDNLMLSIRKSINLIGFYNVISYDSPVISVGDILNIIKSKKIFISFRIPNWILYSIIFTLENILRLFFKDPFFTKARLTKITRNTNYKKNCDISKIYISRVKQRDALLLEFENI